MSGLLFRPGQVVATPGALEAFSAAGDDPLAYPFNFLKHADRDPDGKINIGPMLRFSGDFIMDAILLLQQIANDIPIEAKVFWTWFVSKYPQEFANLPEGSEIRKMQEHKIADWDFRRISYFLEFAEIVKDINLEDKPPAPGTRVE